MNKAPTSNNISGIGALLLATFLFSLFGVFSRIIAQQMGNFYQLSARIIIMCLIFFIVGFSTQSLTKIQKHDYPLFLFRGLLIIIDFSSFLFAVTNLPLGLTLFLFYAASIFSNFIYAIYFLKEKINPIVVVSLVLAFIGLLFIYANGFYNIQLIPSIFAMISGLCFGLTTASSKQLTDKYSITQVNFIAYATAALIGIVLTLGTKEALTLALPPQTWVALLGFSVVSVLAFYLVLYGYNKLEAHKASLIMLAELIFTVIIGYLLYQEIPTFNVIIGGICVLLALALPNTNLQFATKHSE